MRVEATAFWRRLDVPGHDACRLLRGDGCWTLEGTAVFLHDGEPARLQYRAICDSEWRAQSGGITGFMGTAPIDVAIVRADRTWTLNGKPVPGLERCVDLDFGFTPATNLVHLRRAGLGVGGRAEFAVAWIEPPDLTLRALEQRYHRRSESLYWYESPESGYEAELEVMPGGFTRVYPGLWRAEGIGGPANR
jgi:hypothetical protein